MSNSVVYGVDKFLDQLSKCKLDPGASISVGIEAPALWDWALHEVLRDCKGVVSAAESNKAKFGPVDLEKVYVDGIPRISVTGQHEKVRGFIEALKPLQQGIPFMHFVT